MEVLGPGQRAAVSSSQEAALPAPLAWLGGSGQKIAQPGPPRGCGFQNPGWSRCRRGSFLLPGQGLNGPSSDNRTLKSPQRCHPPPVSPTVSKPQPSLGIVPQSIQLPQKAAVKGEGLWAPTGPRWLPSRLPTTPAVLPRSARRRAHGGPAPGLGEGGAQRSRQLSQDKGGRLSRQGCEGQREGCGERSQREGGGGWAIPRE